MTGALGWLRCAGWSIVPRLCSASAATYANVRLAPARALAVKYGAEILLDDPVLGFPRIVPCAMSRAAPVAPALPTCRRADD